MKKRLVKFLAMAVVAVMMLSLSGCGGNNGASENADNGGDVRNAETTQLTADELKAAQSAYDGLIEAIKAVDMELAGKYIDTGNLMNVNVDDLEGGDAIIEAVFSKLESETVACVQSGPDEVGIIANLTTIDLTGVLGYCTQLFMAEVAEGKVTEEEYDSRIEEIYKEEIVKDGLPTVTNQVDVKVKLIDGVWKVELNDGFQNAISGGFIGSIKEAQGAK